MDTLARIKRLVVRRNVLFTQKAENEMASELLTPELVYESILNAPVIFKTSAPAILEQGQWRNYT